MALSLGTLFVKLNADPSQLTKGMNEAADKVAKFGNKMNEISGKLGAVGVSLTALGAGALRLAGQFDANVKRATDDLGNSFNSIMVEIGRALIPVVQALSQALAVVANWMKSLSPETKQMVAGFAAVAAGSLTLTAGVGKLVGAFTSLAPVITGALTPIMPILLPVIGVIAAIVAVVPLLWQAWKSNFGNVQGYTGAVVDWITEKWASFKQYFAGAIEFIGNAWNNMTSFLWKTWASIMKKIASFASKVATVFGADWSNGLEAFNETIDDIASRGFSGLVDDAVSSAKIVAFAWKEGASDIASNIKSLIGGAFKNVFGDAKTGLDKLKSLGGGTPTAAAMAPKPMAPTIVMEPIDVEGKIKKPVENVLASETKTFGAAIQNAGQQVVGHLGELGNIIRAGMQGFEAGGPWGALAAVGIELLAKTKNFTSSLGAALKLIEPIISILDFLLGPIFQALEWLFGKVTQFLNWVDEQIRGAAKDITLIGTGTIEVLPAEVPDAVDALGNAATQTATTLERLNAALTNVPAGFKTAAARFNAASPDIYNLGLGGMQDVEVNLNLDGRVIQKQMVTLNARGRYIAYGGMRPPPFWGS